MGDQNGLHPIEITPVPEDLNRQLLQDFTGERTGFLRVGPQGYFFPRKYAKEGANFYNFQPRPSDVWVVTFPRSGTTWTQEMVWLIMNNLDFETALRVSQDERFPFFESGLCLHDEVKKEITEENASHPRVRELIENIGTPGYQVLEKMTGRRFIKTHLPFSLLPKKLLTVGCKVIYVARNPKDVAVSYYHLNRLFRTQGYKGDFSKYWDYFEKSLNAWTPYWSHVNEGWKLRNNPSVLFLFYEELHKDIQKSIHRVSEFLLGRQLPSEDADKLANYLDISNFRNNPAVNLATRKEAGILTKGEQEFIRKGKTGGWEEEFTPELNKRADVWIKDNLKRTDLRFPGMSDYRNS